MERRADMYITTLQGVTKAMGGRLEIRYLPQWRSAYQPVSGLTEASLASLAFIRVRVCKEACGKIWERTQNLEIPVSRTESTGRVFDYVLITQRSSVQM